MNNKIENKMETQKVHEKEAICARLDIALSDSEFVKMVPEKVLKAFKTFNYIRNDTYNAHVAVCVKDNVIEVAIRHGVMFYRSACEHVCMQLYTCYNVDNCMGNCVELCEKVHKEEAFLSLVDNYRLLTYELRSRGINYEATWDNESPPLTCKVKIAQ